MRSKRMTIMLYRLWCVFLLRLFTGDVYRLQTTDANEATSVGGQTSASNNYDGTRKANVTMEVETVTPIVASQPKSESLSQARVSVESVPASLIVLEGSNASLECRFNPPKAKITWKLSCSPNCSYSFDVVNAANRKIVVDHNNGSSTLSFSPAKRNDTGMYYCFVHADHVHSQSCGTYLWVRRASPVAFLNMSETIKNQIITTEGVLLLICAIGPGLFLLFRKRWENERLIQAKKKALEEENLYEGLNLDECSMYEDISRGLQATYQDIGSVKVIDLQLEKPEKP